MKKGLVKIMILPAILLAGSYALYSLASENSELRSVSQRDTEKGECGAVKNLKGTVGKPHDDGSADLTLTFTTPTTYYESYTEKEGLDEIDRIEILRRNADWNYDILETIESPAVGVEMSVTLLNVPEGDCSLQIVAYNSASDPDYNYRGKAYYYCYIGYDTPAMIEKVNITNSYPTVTLDWAAPTQGYNSGYIDLEDIRYTITRYIGAQSEVVSENQTATSFSDNLSLDKLSEVYYTVAPVNDAGSGYSTESDKIVVGPAQTLPFSESFPDGSATNLWEKTVEGYYLSSDYYISSYGGKYTPFSEYFENGYDNDYGALWFVCSSSEYADAENDVVTYTSSPIDISTAENPALTFYNYRMVRSNNEIKLSVSIISGTETIKVKDFEYKTGDSGWEKINVPLTDYVSGSPIKLVFKAECSNKVNGFAAIDCIKVENSVEKDLQISSFEVPRKARSGESYSVSVSVLNNGSEDADSYSVILYKDGEELNQETGEMLVGGSTRVFTFTNMADNYYAESTTFQAEVKYSGDELPSNNVSEKVKMSVEMADLPQPEDLKGAYDVSSQSVKLSWQIPDYELPDGTEVNEGFEEYDYGSIEFGNWSTDEESMHYTFYLSDYGLNESWDGDKMSYRVMDNNKINFADASKWYGKAHSGDKYLMSLSSSWYQVEDWLISPELSGKEQTLEFYAVSHHPVVDTYDEESIVPAQVFVYVSFSGNASTDFKMKCLTSADDKSKGYELSHYLSEGAEYEKLTATLPEGAKYFAIVVTTPSGKSIVFLDDIKFESKSTAVSKTLLGYNIYRDDERLNSELLTATEYEDFDIEVGNKYDYSVEAVYSIGRSDRDNAIEVEIPDLSGVGTISGSNSEINVMCGGVDLRLPSDAHYQISDLSGRVVRQGVGSRFETLQKGVYLVTVGKLIIKVYIK